MTYRSALVSQHVKSVRDFSSQYGTEGGISYTALNLIGDHDSSFSETHDSSQSYLMVTETWAFYLAPQNINIVFSEQKSYGTWWKSAPSASKSFKERSHHPHYSQDYVELKFEDNVYPREIKVSGQNHQDAVVKILACDLYTLKWHVLWEKSKSLKTPAIFRRAQIFLNDKLFTARLKKMKFATNLIRLEFHHSHLEYYCELRSVCLTGFMDDEMKDVDENVAENLSKVYPSAISEKNIVSVDMVGLNAVSCNFDTNRYLTVRFGRVNLAMANLEYNVNSEYSLENYLEKLPKELIHLIIKQLDLVSLCTISRCSRLLHDLCYTSLLFTEIDLQPYWYKVTDRTLNGLSERCGNMQRLNLSWCGNNGFITFRGISCFFSLCCAHLTALYLSCCSFVSGNVFQLICKSCPKLEELDVSNCNIGQQFVVLDLPFLKRLNLYSTTIDLASLSIILKNCPDLQFLNLGSCSEIQNFDEAALQICSSCRNLRGLDLWRAKTLTSTGIRYLSSLTLLEELDLGWCIEVSPINGCLRELVRACKSLKKLFLCAIRAVSDPDLLCFADLCPHLEQLDILGTREVTPFSIYRLLCCCTNLRLLDVSFCSQIGLVTCERWRSEFPNVDIKNYFY